MGIKKARNVFITIFVLFWTLLFHYESTRYFFLEPLSQRPLPQVQFLFPPAGWIMFFNVSDSFSSVEVYGHRQAAYQRIDPHDILQTRHIGYDNIKRGVLGVVAEPGVRAAFCGFLRRKFPEFDDFVVSEVDYPSVSRVPRLRDERPLYKCSGVEKATRIADQGAR